MMTNMYAKGESSQNARQKPSLNHLQIFHSKGQVPRVSTRAAGPCCPAIDTTRSSCSEVSNETYPILNDACANGKKKKHRPVMMKQQ